MFRGKNFYKRIVTIILAIIMVTLLILPVGAASQAVQDTANGVLKIQFHFDFIDGLEPITSGSCFLINEDTIVTANHCVRLSLNEIKIVNEIFNKDFTEKSIYEHIRYSVVVRDDVTINATLEDHAYSENEDFAVLKLDTPIKTKTPLKIRDSKTVKATETVYSVGFPGSKEGSGLYTANDVAFETGTVNKTQYKDESQVWGFWPLLTCITNNYYYVDENGNYLHDSNGNRIPLNLEERFGKDTLLNYGIMRASGNIYYGLSTFKAETLMLSGNVLSSGNSGGPIVDENGYVVAIAHASSNETSYTTAISQVTEILDMLGIEYQNSDNPSDDTTDTTEADATKLTALIEKAENKSEDKYTKESFEKLYDALEIAKSVVSGTSQSDIDEAAKALQDALDDLEPKSKSGNDNYVTILLVGIVIIGVVVAVILLRKKGKKDVPNNNANAQTYSQNLGDTTLLSGASAGMNGGVLVRLTTNEQIQITGSDFTIGREYGSVSYCIHDNSNISRVHARFTVRNGKTYIADNNSGNGTYLNGERIMPGQVSELRSGDIVHLADEQFEFYS